MDTKQCPKCGEEIKSVAVLCKHCHSDLSSEPDFDRGAPDPRKASPATGDDFEQRFLEFAHKTNQPINATSVAYACKVPIGIADERLEDLAARDLLIREVDDEGHVFYRLPGRPKPYALAPTTPPGPLTTPAVDEATAVVGLLVNIPLPGVGSLILGKTREGVMQIALGMVALPLCLLLVGFPLLFAVWVWALTTGIRAVNDAKAAAASR